MEKPSNATDASTDEVLIERVNGESNFEDRQVEDNAIVEGPPLAPNHQDSGQSVADINKHHDNKSKRPSSRYPSPERESRIRKRTESSAHRSRSRERKRRAYSPEEHWSRSRSRSPHHRSRHRWSRYDDYHSRGRKESDYEKYHRHRRYRKSLSRSVSASPRRRREGSKEREEKDQRYAVLSAERAMRTVFIKDLPSRSTERDIEEWFEKANAPVRDVQLVFDRHRKFKGIGYVEFYQKASVPLALKLSGSDFYGRKIIIESSEAERNLESVREVVSGASQSLSTSDRQSASATKQPVRLYVGNLDYAITEEMVRELFSQFGQLDMCKLQTEANGQSKGRAFIQYNNRENALAAFYYLNQKEVAGRTLRVDFTRDSRAKDHTLPCVNAGGQSQSAESQKAAGVNNEPYESVGDLDDEGLKLTRQTRYFLMQSLAGISQSSEVDVRRADQPSEPSNSTASYSVPQISPRISLPSPGTPTDCACLKNMFDPSAEQSPQFDLEIAEDVREVAEAHGRVVHLHVDKTSFGDVYLKMDGVEAMKNVVKDVHGRFFAGRLVRVEYLTPDVYSDKFPSSGCLE